MASSMTSSRHEATSTTGARVSTIYLGILYSSKEFVISSARLKQDDAHLDLMDMIDKLNCNRTVNATFRIDSLRILDRTVLNRDIVYIFYEITTTQSSSMFLIRDVFYTNDFSNAVSLMDTYLNVYWRIFMPVDTTTEELRNWLSHEGYTYGVFPISVFD